MRRAISYFGIFFFAVAGGVLIPAVGTAQPSNPSVHDGNMSSQHDALSDQMTTHDGAQTEQHNDLSSQGTAHDGAQTTQHDALSSQIGAVQNAVDNISGNGDHSGLPQAWDKILPADDGPDACNSSRFTCVMNNEAVRDNETGLVWDRSPDLTTRSWTDAVFHCPQRTVGGRKGWHLPMRDQLASLVDPAVSFPGPVLPPGHPFQNIQGFGYWSATTYDLLPGAAWLVFFESGVVNVNPKAAVGFEKLAWCVRGGQSFDGNTHSSLH